MNGCCVLENQAYLMAIVYTICLQRGLQLLELMIYFASNFY